MPRLAGPLADVAAPVLLRLAGTMPRAELIPVPVHADRLRDRGYNQATLLARALGRRCGLAVAEPLLRGRPTEKQHRLSRTARLRNLLGAFAVQDGARPPLHAILVDDILTTSATLEACAVVLLEAGAQRVIGFAIAREL